jgi:hypothetical protein
MVCSPRTWAALASFGYQQELAAWEIDGMKTSEVIAANAATRNTPM